MSDASLIWSPRYEVDIGAHVFPTRKYRLVRDRLIEGGTVAPDTFTAPEPVDDETLGLAHTPEYLRKIAEDDFSTAERLQLEVPFSPELADAMRLCCGGTVLAAHRALEQGVAVHLGGGFHHAFADHGEGFCLLNDIAVATLALLEAGPARRVTVVDLDVHHGNGTAAILAGHDRVTTFSMHQENNYPAVKPPSDLDVGLPDRIEDDAYLDLLGRHLPRVLEPAPDLILYLAGADPYREDVLGGLSLSMEGLRTRDRVVLESAHRVGAGIAVTLAGGYAQHTDDTVAIHAATVDEAVSAASRA
ncbi:MAG: histone deacetylase [Gemmatimonadota bacterium]|nr:histone deacetylase [Gemmatimonadota bacterium]